MTHRLVPAALLLSLFSLSAPANTAPATAPDWEEVHKDEMVTVYRKEIEGSDVLALKGEGTLDAPIGKVLGVVLDAVHRSAWMEQVEEIQVLKEISPTEKIEYFHLSPPWPIKDRDLVIRETVEVDKPNKKIVVRMKSIEDPEHPPRGDRVRAELYDASFVVTPADNGKKTAMVAESHADPRGSIPKWIVNIYQKSMPSKTLRRMLERAALPEIAEHPLAREISAQ